MAAETPASAPSAPNAPAAERFPKLAALITYLDSLHERADLSALADLLGHLDVGRCDIAPSCIFGVRGYRRNTCLLYTSDAADE